MGALDRALDELAVQRSVDDDRPPGLELDQHAGRARLVDIFPNWIADRFAETEGLTDYGCAESRFSASSTSARAEALAATFCCWISK